MQKITFFSLLAWGCLIHSAYSLIEKLEVFHDDRSTFHIDSFGFEPGGQFLLQIQNFQIVGPVDLVDPDKRDYKVAFILERSETDSLRLQDAESQCFHDNLRDPTPDIDVIDISDRKLWRQFNYPRTIDVGGYYHLYFSNCEKHMSVNFKMTLEEFNMDNGERVYLSAGEASLPFWHFFLTGVYTIQLLIWLGVLSKNSEHVKTLHQLMALVLVFKIVTAFFEAFRYHSLKTIGHTDGWSILFYIFSFMKGMLMFGVIVLIGTGWSYLKPFLTDRDKNLMLVVLVVQVILNIAMVIVDERAPGSAGWITWRDILHMLDILCCCFILLPIVWSIRHLRQAAGTDGKAGRNVARLKNFRCFYLLVVAYVYFTRIIVFLLSATLNFELVWLATLFSEVATILFFGTTGFLFRPQSSNPYLQVDPEDLDALEDGRREGQTSSPTPALAVLPQL